MNFLYSFKTQHGLRREDRQRGAEGQAGGGMNCGLLGGTGDQSGEARWGHVKGFILLLLRCNWHLTLYYFRVYKLIVCSLYLLRSDHHTKISDHLSSLIVPNFFFLMMRTFKISLNSFQI